MASVNEKMTAIANEIRAKTGGEEKLNLDQMASSIDEVYEAGYEKGELTFWEEYLKNGSRTNFQYSFAGIGWTDNTFKPNRNLMVKASSYMFHGSLITNLKALTEKLGITIDFSQCTSFTYTFGNANITDIGVVDVRSTSVSLQYFAYNSKGLKNFEKLIVNENNVFSSTAFQGTDNLVEIRFEGVIGKNGLNLQWSKKLSHDSLVSIIDCLQDKSGDTSGTEWVVKVGTDNCAKLTEEDLSKIQKKGWFFI